MKAQYILNGDISRPGRYEIDSTMTLREIIDTIGGGVANGKKCKAVQIGGPSSGLLTAEQLDLPLDFKELAKYGVRRGDSVITIIDEDRCIVDASYRVMKLTQQEFCGKCVSCREGTRRMTEMLESLCRYELDEKGFRLLQDLGEMVHITALCNLGKGSFSTLESAIKNFGSEFEAHLAGKCDCCNSGREPLVPAYLSRDLKQIVIDPELCRGCSKCSRFCHAEAITGQIKSPFHINQELCVHCYSCMEVCPFGAIKEVDING